ncbi:hypothetical protein LTR67_010662 [Exophiala xenobiotica]
MARSCSVPGSSREAEKQRSKANMAIEAMPNSSTLKQAFEHEIYSSDGTPLSFGSLFNNNNNNTSLGVTSRGDEHQPSPSILVIFIRHFFCGNCQEYIRRLSSADSPFDPTSRHQQQHALHLGNFSKPTTTTDPHPPPPPAVVIIGPGSPSLLASYASRTQCAFPIYADPSTQLYDILGMHRTLSMGVKSPAYIQHSLWSGAVKSAWQIVKRVGNGDAMDGGDWQVNGGEFLFVWSSSNSNSKSSMTQQQHGHVRHKSRSRSRSRSKSNSPSPAPATRSSSATALSSNPTAVGSSSTININSGNGNGNGNGKWETRWCHRMLNSRDHTELADLQHYASSSSILSSSSSSSSSFLPSSSSRPGSRATSPSPLRSILVNGNTQPRTSHNNTKHHSHSHSHSHSKTRSSFTTRSYSSDCLGSCPGPDVPKSHEETLLRKQALYTHAHAHARPSSKASQHQRITGTVSLSRPRSSSSRNQHQRSKSVASTTTTRAESKATQYPTLSLAEEGEKEEEDEDEQYEQDVPLPWKSFTMTTLASRVGMALSRSKSFSSANANANAKSHHHHHHLTPREPNRQTATMDEDVTSNVAADHDDDEHPASQENLVEGSGSGNGSGNGSGPTKRSIVSSLVRSVSTKNSNQSTKAIRRRPQTATPTSVPVHVTMPESTKETLVPQPNPIHPTSSLLRPSLSLSRRKSKTRTTTTTKPTRQQQRNTIEMDDNGIMLVDGVEFVNVISLKARVDRVDSGFSETEKTTTTTTTTTKSGVLHAHAHQQGRPAPDMPITTLPMPMPISLPTAAVQG